MLSVNVFFFTIGGMMLGMLNAFMDLISHFLLAFLENTSSINADLNSNRSLTSPPPYVKFSGTRDAFLTLPSEYVISGRIPHVGQETSFMSCYLITAAAIVKQLLYTS